MRTRRRFLVTTVVIALGAVAFAHYNLKLLANSRVTERGTYAFYVLIASSMRDLPAHKPSAAAPLYFYAPADVGPLENALLYCAQTSSDDIAAFYSKYFEGAGFARDAGDEGASFSRSDERYALEIVSEADCPTFVKIHYFRY